MFSFKITKKPSSTSAPVVAQKSSGQTPSSKKAFNDDDDKEEDEPDFIDGLDGSNIISKKPKKPEKEVLVIPLINKNEWRVDKKTEEGEEATVPGEGSQEEEPVKAESLQEQAVKELLQEASSGSSSDKKKSRTIPILFQNRVPAGYEEDDNMDVSLRPEQSTLDDYERIPIEDFGLAVLRGMGWKETEGIGLKNKKVVDMAVPKLRPKGMGLGAESAHLNKNVVPQNASSANEEKEVLSMKIGGYAVITKGSKKGYYGQIESFDEDNNRVIMKLGISGKMEAVSKFYINVVPASEYKKNSKVINSEKYEEYKAKQDKKDRQRRERNTEDYEEPEEPRQRKTTRSDSDSDDSNEDYRSRSKSKRKERNDYEYEERNGRRSGHKEKDGERTHHKKSNDRGRDRKDDYDRDRHASSSRHESRKHEDRDQYRNDDHHRNSSRNGKGDRDNYRSRKDDNRDRRH